MAGTVIAVVNMKGGVGKTSVVVGLAETLAAERHKPAILVMDIDAQASASYCIAGNEVLTRLIKERSTIDEYFSAAFVNGPKLALRDLIARPATNVTSDGVNLDVGLLASSVDLRMTEREIIFELTDKGHNLKAIEAKTAQLLQPELEALRKEYEFIIIDCAPGISAFTDAALRNADLVIVPTIPDFVSHAGMGAFVGRVLQEQRAQKLVAFNRLPHVLISKKKNTRQHNEYSRAIRNHASRPNSGFKVFGVEIPETADFPKALERADDQYPPTYHNKYGTNLVLSLYQLAFEVRSAVQ